jgi:hypothetical protein
MIQQAAEFLARNNAKAVAEAIARDTAPVLVRFISRVASQFNLTVTEKFLACSLPVIGVATGALVNAAFTDHFNSVARYHFGIRKLERQYGQEQVQGIYRSELKRIKELAGPPNGRSKA